MSRLYDRIHENGVSGPRDATGEQAHGRIWTAFNAMEHPVIEITNVADYIKEVEFNRDGWSGIPNAAPPFWAAFYEARRPPWNGDQFSWGVLVNAIDTEWVKDQGSSTYPDDWEDKWPDAHWLLDCFYYLENDLGKPFGPLMGVQLGINQDGSLPVRGDNEVLFSRYFVGKGWPQETQDWLDENASYLFACVLLANCFTHCKNVEVTEVQPPPKVQKRRERKHRPPLTTYRVLEIDPMRQALKNEGRIGGVGLLRALHICRGHFATYSPDKPLFGKYAGTFWKPQHVRGNKERGEIVKDYAIKSPEGSTS